MIFRAFYILQKFQVFLIKVDSCFLCWIIKLSHFFNVLFEKFFRLLFFIGYFEQFCLLILQNRHFYVKIFAKSPDKISTFKVYFLVIFILKTFSLFSLGFLCFLFLPKSIILCPYLIALNLELIFEYIESIF